ncbi:MAG: PHB depolymerase family esterase [Chitinophagaceae bacterium]|nr:PHB depolymerase family esterase [Rubrivivax sp.]
MTPHSVSATIERALAAARLTRSAPALDRVTQTIRQALESAGIALPTSRMQAPGSHTPRAPGPGTRPRPGQAEAPGTREFGTHSFAIGAASRDYKLFVPTGCADKALPLVVMLHGCKQDPDDFAAGTRMNVLAQEQGFLVAYPAQVRRANGANCWNWFQSAQQSRGGEEAALIAGMVGDIAQSHGVDPQRVFVAGLSAGAAMAVILGAAYPEVFAAVGVHSGLPLGAARDVPSAFAAMRNGAAARTGTALAQPMPTIVLHGDRDDTVAAVNGVQVAQHAVAAYATQGAPLKASALPRREVQGRDVSVTRYDDDTGRPRVEHWLLHGGAHAWSGGSDDGSYTDGRGPDASAEMLRFFLRQ